MVVATRTSVPERDAMRAWIAEQMATLTPEERARYDTDVSFRSIVLSALEHEWRSPGPTPIEQEATEKYDGDQDRCFVEQFVAHVLERHPAEVSARISALRAERYGTGFAREAAEIQDGTHPVQQLRC